jgi:hypothetical protein
MHARLGLSVLAALVWAGVGVSVCSPPVQADGVCPNEALRQELNSGSLPDCRAYEMVTPAFKDGASAFVLAVSGDGLHLVASALGAFAATEGEQANEIGGPVYEFSRTASGWTTTPLDPPAARFPALAFRGASRDLTRTLWLLREPSEAVTEADLYVREPEGRFVKVGPLVGGESGPPGGTDGRLGVSFVHYVGASSDLSHIIISDQIGNSPLLYEYVGTQVTKPELVALNDEGKQISNCGTTLGGTNGDEGYNAVSSNGERVFFTAQGLATNGCARRLARERQRCEEAGRPIEECEELFPITGPEVDELYVRVNRAETLDLSEPSHRQCEACLTATRQPAEFQGASEDGSKAFFTTEQELLTGQTTENLYEFDFDRAVGHQIALVSEGSKEPKVQGVARVSEDGSHVYFVAKGVLTTEPNREGLSPKPESDNLYVFEQDGVYPHGRVQFVVTLSEADSSDWQAVDVRPVQATPDGRFLVFDSASQVYEYDAKEEILANVSAGRPATILNPAFTEGGANPIAEQSELGVSSDGAYVLLGSGGDGHGRLSEYHSVGSIANGNVFPIFGSDGRFGGAMIDASGDDVFFQSLDSLIGSDTNTGEDTYDARVNGGFPEAAIAGGCEGEACQGVRSSVPLFGSPGSVTAKGGGNLPPPPAVVIPKPKPKTVKCKKGFTKNHNRCVKNKSKKKPKKASNKRGAKL